MLWASVFISDPLVFTLNLKPYIHQCYFTYIYNKVRIRKAGLISIIFPIHFIIINTNEHYKNTKT